MMSPAKPEESSRRFSERALLATQLIFAITSVTALSLSLTDRLRLSIAGQYALLGALGALFYTLAIVFIFRRLRRRLTVELRMAVTGLPRAGKTVFSILLFDALMNSRLPGVSFSADSRSPISVYQAIRSIPAGTWPRSTSRGAVSIYEGTIDAGRLRIELELGDSAGEYWLDIGEERDRDPGYTEYVLSANALVHVISLEGSANAQELRGRLADDVQDLLLISRLKRQARGGAAEMPLLLVLSKVDLVIPSSELDELHHALFAPDPLGSWDDSRIAQRLPPQVGKAIFEAASSLTSEYGNIRFCFSSALPVAENRLGGALSGNGLLTWLAQQATDVVQSSRRGMLRRIARLGA